MTSISIAFLSPPSFPPVFLKTERERERDNDLLVHIETGEGQWE